MRISIIILLLFFKFTYLNAQCTYENIYSAYTPLYGAQNAKIISTSDGGNLIVTQGYYDSLQPDGGSNSGGDIDMIVIKTDSCGKTLWRTLYGYPTEIDGGMDVVEATNGDYMVLGQADWQQATNNIRVVRFSSSGIIKWSKLYTGNLTSVSTSLIKRQNSNSYIISGWTDHMITPKDLYGGYLLEIDENGAVLKSKEFFGYDNILQARNVFQANDSSYSLIFQSKDSIFLYETDTSFNIRWKKNLFTNSLYDLWYHGACISSDKKSIALIVEGTPYYNPLLTSSNIVAQFNLNGDSIHLNTIDRSGYRPQSISCMPNNGYSISGPFDGSSILLTDSNLNFVKTQKFNPSISIFSTFVNTDNSIICSGYSTQTSVNGRIDILKIDNNGFYIHSHAGVQETQLQSTDLKIYPNPTSNELHIQTTSSEKLTVQLFDVTGKQVIENISFNNTTTINTSSLNQGLYFVRISDNNNQIIQTKKLSIIK